jgi:hypothetical protein
MSAYLAVRSPRVQPRDFENLVSGSERKSYFFISFILPIKINSSTRMGRRKWGREKGAYNVFALDPISLPPRTHDKSIIIRNASYDVHALWLEGRKVGDVAGEMAGRAAGGEGAGDGEEDYALVCPFYPYHR